MGYLETASKGVLSIDKTVALLEAEQLRLLIDLRLSRDALRKLLGTAAQVLWAMPEGERGKPGRRKKAESESLASRVVRLCGVGLARAQIDYFRSHDLPRIEEAGALKEEKLELFARGLRYMARYPDDLETGRRFAEIQERHFERMIDAVRESWLAGFAALGLPTQKPIRWLRWRVVSWLRKGGLTWDEVARLVDDGHEPPGRAGRLERAFRKHGPGTDMGNTDISRIRESSVFKSAQRPYKRAWEAIMGPSTDQPGLWS